MIKAIFVGMVYIIIEVALVVLLELEMVKTSVTVEYVYLTMAVLAFIIGVTSYVSSKGVSGSISTSNMEINMQESSRNLIDEELVKGKVSFHLTVLMLIFMAINLILMFSL